MPNYFKCQFDSSFTTELQQHLITNLNSAFETCCEQLDEDPKQLSAREPSAIFSHGYGGSGDYNGIEVRINESQLDLCSKLIHHELVHYVQASIVGNDKLNTMPTWFKEGMAVALSGQGVLFKREHLDQVVQEFNEFDAEFERMALMGAYEYVDINKKPYDTLYDVWGTLFLSVVSESGKMHAEYAEDDGPHLNPGELLTAKRIIVSHVVTGFRFPAVLPNNKTTPNSHTVYSELRNFLPT